MENCYDVSKYEKGRRIYRVRDLEPGKKYILQSDECALVAVIIRLDFVGGGFGVDFMIENARQYNKYIFEIRLWPYMVETWKRSAAHTPEYEIYEAVEPLFTCSQCGSHDIPTPIPAFYPNSGQIVGRSCNYCRCKHCGTINRLVWVSGYPFQYSFWRKINDFDGIVTGKECNPAYTYRAWLERTGQL